MSITIFTTQERDFSPAQRTEIFEIMRKAYASTEIEIWGENYVRMPQAEYEELIDDGKITVALLENEIVGCVYARKIDDDTFTFGLLATHKDFGNLGIGRKLIEQVEEKARISGAKFMNIEILRPRDFSIPMKDRLRAWYEGMGYVFTHNQNFQDRRPDRAKDLKVPSVFDCYGKVL